MMIEPPPPTIGALSVILNIAHLSYEVMEKTINCEEMEIKTWFTESPEENEEITKRPER
jgi:hypothetical protein